MAETDYSTLRDRPYDQFLERTGSSATDFTNSNNTNTNPGNALTNNSGSTEATDGTIDNGSVEKMPVKSDAGMADLWITNLLRSTNWKPKKVGFLIDGQTGYAEFTNVYVSGNIQALTGLIGGFTIGATDLTATDGTNTTILSSRTTAFSAGPNGAPTITITQAGVLSATGAIISGTITATTGIIGGWTINATNLSATGIVLDAGNQKIQVGASAPIIIDGVAKEIESDNYVSGVFGSGFHLDSNLLEVGNIAARGMIRTAVFQKDVVSAVGGNVAILDADVLTADMTILDNSTLTIEGNTTFVTGDILRIKDGIDDEWMTVVSGPTGPAKLKSYVVTRDMAATYAINTNPAWTKGSSVINYQQSGDGGVYMTASDTNAPYISIFDHAGSPWATINTRMRMGNLNGYLGYASDLYGIGIGETNSYLKYDPSNGLRIKGDITITGGNAAVTFYQATEPLTGMKNGDYWIDTDDNSLHVYQGSWLLVAASGVNVFTAEPTTPYHLGDLWANGTFLKICNVERLTGPYEAADWGYATGYTDDTVANSKIKTFIQTTIPTSISAGDLWIDSDDGNKLYRATAIGDTTIAAGHWVAVLTDFANVDGATKPENNATVGAAWGTNLSGIPTTLTAPSGDGLYLSSTYMGFYKSSAWKTYIDNAGNLLLGDIAGGNTGMSWDQVGGTLSIIGDIVATSGKFGSLTNYWNVSSVGLTAVSTNADIFLNYGKTDFGQDTIPGFILGYDYSATKAKFEIGTSATGLLKYDGSLSIEGGTITGGLIQTAIGTGHRIVMDGATNELTIYNENNEVTVFLDGSATDITSSQMRVAGGIFLSGSISALDTVGMDIGVSGGEFPGGTSAEITAQGADGYVGTCSIRSDGEFWHYGSGGFPVVILGSSGDVLAASFTLNSTTITDWSDIGSGVTSVTASSPLSSSGGTTPDISIDLSNYATLYDLTDYATWADLSNYATYSDLSDYVTNWNNETVNGAKTFSESITANGGIYVPSTDSITCRGHIFLSAGGGEYLYDNGSNIKLAGHGYTLTLSSNKTAIVPTSEGYNALYCTESPEVWFMDFCDEKGKLDPMFEEVTSAPYRYIKCEDDGGYQVWGKRKGHEKYRFESKTYQEFLANEKFLNMNKP